MAASGAMQQDMAEYFASVAGAVATLSKRQMRTKHGEDNALLFSKFNYSYCCFCAACVVSDPINACNLTFTVTNPTGENITLMLSIFPFQQYAYAKDWH